MGICDNKNEPQNEINKTQPINNMGNNNGLIKAEDQAVIQKAIQPIIVEKRQPIIIKEIHPIIHQIIQPVYQIRKKPYNIKENSIILNYPLDNINLQYIQNIDQKYIEKCFEKAEREILKPREPQQQNQDRGEILNLHSQPYPQIEGTSFDRVPPNIKIVEQPVAPRDIQPNIQIEERYCERHLLLPPIVQREFKLLTVRKIEVIFQNQF